MEKQKNFWDKNAGRYDCFMRKDDKDDKNDKSNGYIFIVLIVPNVLAI